MSSGLANWVLRRRMSVIVVRVVPFEWKRFHPAFLNSRVSQMDCQRNISSPPSLRAVPTAPRNRSHQTAPPAATVPATLPASRGMVRLVRACFQWRRRAPCGGPVDTAGAPVVPVVPPRIGALRLPRCAGGQRRWREPAPNRPLPVDIRPAGQGAGTTVSIDLKNHRVLYSQALWERFQSRPPGLMSQSSGAPAAWMGRRRGAGRRAVGGAARKRLLE
jgi:hypothetical protein